MPLYGNKENLHINLSEASLIFNQQMNTILNIRAALLLIGFLVLGGIPFLGCRQSSPKVRIGCKNFTEQLILGEIIAQAIQKVAPEIPIEKKWGFGSTPLIHEALLHGEIDLYIEYSGTAEQLILKSPHKLSKEDLDFQYQTQFQSQWLPALGFSNGYVLIVRKDSTLPSKLSECAPLISLQKAGFNAEFSNRPDGFPLIQKYYQLRFQSVVNLDVGLLYPALESKKVDLISGFSTDAKLNLTKYRSLEDDLQISPRYEAAPVVRIETLNKYPSLKPALQRLSGKISESTMRTLNAAVEIDHKSPYDVAQQWIEQQFSHQK